MLQRENARELCGLRTMGLERGGREHAVQAGFKCARVIAADQVDPVGGLIATADFLLRGGRDIGRSGLQQMRARGAGAQRKSLGLQPQIVT